MGRWNSFPKAWWLPLYYAKLSKKRSIVEMTAEFAAAAIIGLEQKRQELDVKIAELRQIAIGETSASASKTSVAKPKRKRCISADAREKMADAQRRRWAAVRKSEKPLASKKKAQAKRRRVQAKKAAQSTRAMEPTGI